MNSVIFAPVRVIYSKATATGFRKSSDTADGIKGQFSSVANKVFCGPILSTTMTLVVVLCLLVLVNHQTNGGLIDTMSSMASSATGAMSSMGNSAVGGMRQAANFGSSTVNSGLGLIGRRRKRALGSN